MIRRFALALAVSALPLTAATFTAATFVAAVPFPAAAQTESVPQSPDDLRESVLEEILATRGDITAQIEAVIAKLPEITTSVEQADAAFDEIIATLRAQAELGNPDGEFVKQIEKLADLARADAGAARVEGLPEFEQEFLAQAESFEADATTATQFYDSLDRRIRAIEAERTRIVFLIKLKRYEEAKSVVNAGLDVLRDADAKLGEIEASIQLDGVAN